MCSAEEAVGDSIDSILSVRYNFENDFAHFRVVNFRGFFFFLCVCMRWGSWGEHTVRLAFNVFGRS